MAQAVGVQVPLLAPLLSMNPVAKTLIFAGVLLTLILTLISRFKR